MKQLLISFCLGIVLPTQAAWFGYDRGISAAHDGDSERAAFLLTDELTTNPENPSLLYDNGVVASLQKNYAQAESFFSKAVEHTKADSQLHRQSLFNLGNTFVSEQKLREALATYNQLLVLDPHHEKARHNYDVVKKMLEQQSQKQSQNDKNKKQDNKKEQNNSQSQNDQQQDQQSSDKNSSSDNQQSQSQGGKSQGSQQQQEQQKQNAPGQEQRDGGQQQDKQKKSQQQSAQDSHASEKDSMNNEQSSTSQKKNDQQSSSSSSNQNNQERDNKKSDQLDERDGYKERYGKRNGNADDDEQQRSQANASEDMKNKSENKESGNDQRTQQHDGSPSRTHGVHKDDTPSKTMKVVSKAQESAKKEKKKQYAAWAESMLDAVQLNDEALNKILVQKAVAGNLGGRDGECCW